MIVAETRNAVMLDVPVPVEGYWHTRPGMHRVARPYDVDTMEAAPQQDVLANQQRPSKRRKVKAPPKHDDQEQELVAWIKQELVILTCTKEAQLVLLDASHYKYGTLVDQPPSEAFAVDFAGQAETLRLLKHGFGSNHRAKNRANDDAASIEPFPSLVLPQSNINHLDVNDVYETTVSNTSDNKAELLCFSSSPSTCPEATLAYYMIPPRSTFIMSDFDQIHRLPNTLTNVVAQEQHSGRSGFNIIVMDPPWQNASVDRMAHYATMDMYELFKIPMSKLFSPSSSSLLPVVAVWITNRPKVYKLVTEKLFPAWGLELVACWYWLKVTTKGEPVLNLDNHHRRPYERVLIGRPCRKDASSSIPSQTPATESTTPLTKAIDRKLVVSVPSLHSRKPCLGPLIERDFFKDHQQPSGASQLNKLELFARSLESGWVSWGNEPLRFQYCGHNGESAPQAELVQDGFLVPAQ